MNYQKLEQASELYMKLNAVNEQIAGLEKIAMQVIDGGPEVSLSLSILSPKEFETPAKDEIEEYYTGKLPNAIMAHFSGQTITPWGKHEPVNQPTKFYQTLSDVVTLQILNMIMYEKRQIKKGLKERIEALNLV